MQFTAQVAAAVSFHVATKERPAGVFSAGDQFLAVELGARFQCTAPYRIVNIGCRLHGPSLCSYSSVNQSNGPKLTISIETGIGPAGLVSIAQAAKRIGVDRSWAFRVHRSGLLKTTYGARPVLISAAELAALRKRQRPRPRRAVSAATVAERNRGSRRQTAK
jgi:hypothetical protein